jgi:hypothetical protein
VRAVRDLEAMVLGEVDEVPASAVVSRAPSSSSSYTFDRRLKKSSEKMYVL